MTHRNRIAAPPLLLPLFLLSLLSLLSLPGCDSAPEPSSVIISETQEKKLGECTANGHTKREMLDCISRRGRSVASNIAGKQRAHCSDGTDDTVKACKTEAANLARVARSCLRPCDQRGTEGSAKDALSCVVGCLAGPAEGAS